MRAFACEVHQIDTHEKKGKVQESCIVLLHKLDNYCRLNVVKCRIRFSATSP